MAWQDWLHPKAVDCSVHDAARHVLVRFGSPGIKCQVH